MAQFRNLPPLQLHQALGLSHGVRSLCNHQLRQGQLSEYLHDGTLCGSVQVTGGFVERQPMSLNHGLFMNLVRVALHLWLLMTAGLLATACTSEAWFPPEFQLRHTIFEVEKSHRVGPGGMSQRFVVYALPDSIADKIAAQGLAYLNALPSTAELAKKVKPPRVDSYQEVNGQKVPSVTGPWSGPFTNWAPTPVAPDLHWLRGRQKVTVGWRPSLLNFFSRFKGDMAQEMVTTIPADVQVAFNEAISSSGSFFAYGHYRGMCLLVVSPETRKVYFLFRD